jgi:2,6-dihydroxypseudooxynicotine hydrolase
VDERVASAIANWAPRFTTNGVAVADFERVTRGLQRWEDWCQAWSEVAAEHEALAVEAVSEQRLRSAGQHYAQAAVYYHFAKFLFVQDRDQMRTAHAAAVRCLNAALPYLDPPGRRVEIPYAGARLVGVLRLPAGPGPHPVVVMIPGLDSAKEEFRSTEALFLERGIGTFSVDGPGQGEAEYDLAIQGDWEKPGSAILDAVAAQDGVGGEPRRLLRAAGRQR